MLKTDPPAKRIVVVDTSVLVNFLRINRMDLIESHPDTFMATGHVAAEVTSPEQRCRYAKALSAGQLVEQDVDAPAEVGTFLRLSREGRLGVGERSAIAVALNRNHRLAIEDNAAIKRAIQEAGISRNPVSIMRTQDIITELIGNGALTVEAADSMLVDWADNHRFKLKIPSFRDVL